MNLFASYRKIFQSPYESQVMQLIGLIGLLRVVVAIVQDLRNPIISTTELVTDSCILLVFLVLCLFALRLRVEKIPLVFGIVLTALLAINFLQFGGVSGYTEFNFIVGIVLLVLLYTDGKKIVLVVCMLSLLAILLVLIYTNHAIYQMIFIKQQYNPEDFVYSLIGLSVLTFYLKYSMDMERNHLLTQKYSLQTAVAKTTEQHALFINQQKQLQHAQQKLEAEVHSRTQLLQNQNNAIEQYIQYNTTELKEPLERLKQSLSQLQQAGMLSNLLHMSVAELEGVTTTIATSLENERAAAKSKTH